MVDPNNPNPYLGMSEDEYLEFAHKGALDYEKQHGGRYSQQMLDPKKAAVQEAMRRRMYGKISRGEYGMMAERPLPPGVRHGSVPPPTPHDVSAIQRQKETGWTYKPDPTKFSASGGGGLGGPASGAARPAPSMAPAPMPAPASPFATAAAFPRPAGPKPTLPNAAATALGVGAGPRKTKTFNSL